MISAVLQPFKDFLFVSSCFHCGNHLSEEERRICKSCWDSATPVGRNDYTFTVLKERFADGGVIDDIIAMYYFEKGKLLQSLAHSLKYEEVTAFGFELGIRLAAMLGSRKIDGIVPVPLNKRKERERGYNQSEWIGKGISSVTNIPVWPHAVRRIKYTITQTHLNADQRKENIAEAFEVADAGLIKDKSVLIVDDIITTGSTIQEVSRVLKSAGAGSIVVGSAGLAKLGEGG